MPAPQFVHLRVRSEYSISDSIVRIDDLVTAAAQDGQAALAIADAANVFGWIKFYRAARERGIKPILGTSLWLANDAERDRPFEMLVLVRNRTGYRNLCELLSRAWLENASRGHAEVRREWFQELARDTTDGCGLIVLSGAQRGDVGVALAAGQVQTAETLARQWQTVLPGAYYLEVQRTGAPEVEAYVRAAAHLAQRLALPLVATHPVQFIASSDFRAHEARVCIAEGEVLANPRRVRRFSESQYFLTQSEMAERFADLPQALANAVQIAQRCNLTMELGKSRLPDFPTPDGLSIEAYLRRLADEGLNHRLLRIFTDPAEREAERPPQTGRWRVRPALASNREARS